MRLKVDLQLPRGRILSLGRATRVMGILNCTPDSFYDGGRHEAPGAALEQAQQMEQEGADLIDVGGESTRPGSAGVTAEEEIERVVPVIAEIRAGSEIPISIDTSKAKVARAALRAGADIINDVTALQGDGAMPALAAEEGCPVVLMHMKGTPADMQDGPDYGDVCAEVSASLHRAAEQAEEAGVARSQIVVDPGFGFGKTLAHNSRLLCGLEELGRQYPVLVGLSRKSMIQHALDLPVEERLEASLALAVMAADRGAAVVRTHDVKATKRAVAMVDAVRGQEL